MFRRFSLLKTFHHLLLERRKVCVCICVCVCWCLAMLYDIFCWDDLLSETGDWIEVALSVADLSLDFWRAVNRIGPTADGHARNRFN